MQILKNVSKIFENIQNDDIRLHFNQSTLGS
jgi:hypothetical protein